jgi:hypothetical protein
MWTWLKELDRILRGDATRISALRDGALRIPVFGIGFLVLLLGLFAGFCVGWFALFNRPVPAYEQLLASALKVPLLFFLTLLVTFPSLYVFNALVGSRLSLGSVLRLLIAALAVTVAVTASFGPIIAFFSVSTENYSFMVLLNVLLYAVAGMLGLGFLLQTLHRLSILDEFKAGMPATPGPTASQPAPTSEPSMPAATPAGPGQAPEEHSVRDELGALDRLEGQVLGRHVKAVFYSWIIVFGLVGAQMAGVLRPFIGDPHRPFTWFRPRSSNFFESVLHAFESLFP